MSSQLTESGLSSLTITSHSLIFALVTVDEDGVKSWDGGPPNRTYSAQVCILADGWVAA
jgi:hypothetical protein